MKAQLVAFTALLALLSAVLLESSPSTFRLIVVSFLALLSLLPQLSRPSEPRRLNRHQALEILAIILALGEIQFPISPWLMVPAAVLLIVGVVLNFEARDQKNPDSVSSTSLIWGVGTGLVAVICMCFIARLVLFFRSHATMMPGNVDYLSLFVFLTAVWLGLDAVLRTGQEERKARWLVQHRYAISTLLFCVCGFLMSFGR
jgi:hypothetical protein